ncbi:glutathione S-transferase family protein [Dichotomicrobium thermohalophilum]|uniref:Putative glutathione S-transferase n=1 Tax=Dichotomicrobium thermohalophilum TaxID=933063 RepID=A0A397PD97_9HYPH|nr:glutathione S-transferase family protein [Dichotomicrobium thermohalophilum]RIA47476.1 putative glutathione S-transferase [Dichotomicrobium thermohalophilum]
MGLLIDGVWYDKWYDTEKTGGRFVRSESVFRNWITPDGSPGPSGEGGFAAEPGRYHLYVSLACPWAHRTLIFRALKGLEDMISVDVVHPDMGSEGWVFDDSYPGATGDTVNGAKRLYENYLKAKPDYTGRVTVPTLWDKKRETIVSNESAEIIRMLNSAFDHVGAAKGDYYPQELRDEIDAINERVYTTVNNGVYKCGFATTQDAYEENFHPLFDTLDHIEDRLSRNRYLVGDRLTEADWRLFTTLVRFDAVYYSHFKCNQRRIIDYPNIWGYVRELYQMPGIADTVSLDHIKRHYYGSHETINPSRIVPVGPEIHFNAPHSRDHLPNASPLPMTA